MTVPQGRFLGKLSVVTPFGAGAAGAGAAGAGAAVAGAAGAAVTHGISSSFGPFTHLEKSMACSFHGNKPLFLNAFRPVSGNAALYHAFCNVCIMLSMVHS